MSNDLLENARQNLAIGQRYGSVKEIAKWSRIVKQLEKGSDGCGPESIMYKKG